MAQKVLIQLIDDIDGSEAKETVKFGLDGVNYEIDLSEANAARLRDDLASWVGAARKTGRGSSTATRSKSSAGGASKEELNAMREWGRANGFKVSDRGRVSREVQEAYADAHS